MAVKDADRVDLGRPYSQIDLQEIGDVGLGGGRRTYLLDSYEPFEDDFFEDIGFGLDHIRAEYGEETADIFEGELRVADDKMFHSFNSQLKMFESYREAKHVLGEAKQQALEAKAQLGNLGVDADSGAYQSILRGQINEGLKEANDIVDAGRLAADSIAKTESIERANARRREDAAIMGTVFGIAGAVVGGFVGGPGGAAAGYGIGSGIGTVAGSM